MSVLFVDTAENFHPFECGGKGKCVHCDRRVTEKHDPATCGFCQDDVEEGRA